MCGIVGLINSEESLTLDAIQHRGPDDKGSYIEGNVKLGQTRLSIQDLSSRGHQPYISDDQNYVLIYNGEIYNHWDIRKGLEQKGYSFTSTSDTETILKGYIEFGVGVIPMLNGIFAFCLYDKRAGKLIVARDRFGVKPLYYYFQGNSFGFASELKALIEITPGPLELDIEALSNYVRFLWSPGEATPVKQIHKLLQGRYIEIDLDRVSEAKFVQYYKSGLNSEYSKEPENVLVDKLEEHLVNAVRRQLLSDVPVGFFLSGGLDSSLLVAIARKLMPDKKLQCFTIEAPLEHSADTGDLRYAKLVAEHLGVNLEIVRADVSILRDFDKMIFHLDEPLADPAALNVLNISRRAREMGYTVLIGGTAGDDLFSGYRRHQALRFDKVLNTIPQFIRPSLRRLFAGVQASNPKVRRIKKMVESLSYSNTDRMFGYFEWLHNSVVRAMLKDPNKFPTDPFAYFRKLLAEIPREHSRLNQLLHLEMNTFLVDHNLNYTDKMGMAVAVEIRVPFLDNDLVDFSFTVPPDLKLKGNETKYLLKKVAERYLPNEVIYRDKTGFGAPVRKWVVEDLQGMINERLSKERINARGIFNAEKVQELIHQNQAQTIDASYSVWALLAIESWLEQFVDNNTKGATFRNSNFILQA
ncbi:MAG: asparagine synthase (glutamine-hydrolyzing) [Bacteroidota bacterium]